jgi:hypothetical protein
MAIDTISPITPDTADATLPKLAPPAQRESKKLGVWDFAKSVLLVIAITKLSAAAGYVAGRFTPNEMLPRRWRHIQVKEVLGKKYYPLATYAAFVTGSVGGYIEGWRHWRKDKAKQLGVKDIHADIYTELNPQILQAEVEQNQRIQDGIKTIIEQRRPAATHAEAEAKAPSPEALMLR